MANSDPLREYRRKRNFEQTSEPSDKSRSATQEVEATQESGGQGVAATRAAFVVQKHSARSLHYDFRLELNGVLLSWAVPKGPNLDPSIKRLARQTENHPLEYASFEGTIPEGNYGSGSVIVWDQGTWRALGDADEQYRTGHLQFELYGEKLRGKWHLVRRGDAKRWLLFKSRDTEARTGAPAELAKMRPESVVSGRRVEQVLEPDKSANAKQSRIDSTTYPAARKGNIPNVIAPQLASLAKNAPDGDAWLHEVKFDGYRIQLHVDGNKVRALTRGGHDWTERMRKLTNAASALAVRSAVIDGELCVLRKDGRSDFQALQNALKERSGPSLTYFAFDLLFLDGWDLRRVPLLERKSLLHTLVNEKHPLLRFSDHVRGSGPQFFNEACRRQLEGVISKRVDGPYVSKRSSSWLKVKCSRRQELVIGGFTPPGGSREHFGALLVGAHDEQGQLTYRGKVGSGFTHQSLAHIRARLKPLQRKTSPFASVPKSLTRTATWVSPVLLAEVEFTELTSEGVLRHPTFKGLREDKPAREVKMEESQAVPPAPEPAVLEPARSQVRLTNPGRVLYPEQGITKRDLAGYYVSVAQSMLPHVAGRILTLVRCPQGQSKECFYQKHLTSGMPDAIAAVAVSEKDKTVEYMSIRDAIGLLSLVQFGVLEIHAWGAHADRPDRPDQIVFDLDPSPEVEWSEVIKGAFAVRQRLGDLGLRSFVKTTGGKGLHVVVPVERRLNWDATKAFCRAVAHDIVTREPAKYVATMSKEHRRGRIFIDYLRNGRGATSVCAYSTRARPQALVATPLAWDELLSEVRPEHFTIATVSERVARQGDKAWSAYFDTRQSITKAMRLELGLKE